VFGLRQIAFEHGGLGGPRWRQQERVGDGGEIDHRLLRGGLRALRRGFCGQRRVLIWGVSVRGFLYRYALCVQMWMTHGKEDGTYEQSDETKRSSG
jgi:hypothetical protein